MYDVKMQPGYCFTLAKGPEVWGAAKNDDWEINIYSPKGDEQLRGQRRIDGSLCFVWYCRDGRYRAQVNFSGE